ncbi:MAG: PilC/PilY family type IV pilus protein [Gammaproteobacteria bacterium]|nr:PilC/PilY family type IV pilus protein [Gammaproteobacteria bacterium]
MKHPSLTKLISLKVSHLSVIGLLFVLNMPSAIPADAPGNLANEPLQTSATAEPNIVFLLDNSGSMNSNNISVGVKRWDALKTTMSTLLDGLNRVRVGIASFSNDGEISHDLTLLDTTDASYSTNLAAIKATMNGLTTGGNGTILAETFQDVGRYYANNALGQCGGSATAELTIHPGDNAPGDVPPGLRQNIACSALLGNKATIVAKNEATIYSCQKNFAIVLSDGLTNSDIELRTDTIPTYTTATHPFNDYDQDCTATAQTDGSYTCNAGNLDQKSIYTYNATGSDFLDDVAQAFYEMDLRPDYTEYKNNITTFTVGFADTTMDPTHADYNPLMESTATQAGGEYFYASSASTLLSSFQSSINSIISQTSTSSAVTFNSSTLSSQSAVYQALFNTSSWSGELNSFPIDGFTGDINTSCTPGTNNCWNAHNQLDNQSASSRFIITYGDASHGVNFAYNTSTDDYTSLVSNTDIPQGLVADICGDTSMPFPCNASTTADATKKAANSSYIADIVDYLRGDNSEEGPSSTRQFRARLHDLGDVVNSSPVFVGAPQLDYPISGVFPPWNAVTADDKSHSVWKKTSVKDRTEVVYVAANDGMLHGFKTRETTVSGVGQGDAGNEIFAYVPTTTFKTGASEGLHFLADKNYSHRYYNDLSPTISDVYIDHRNASGQPTGSFNVGTMAKDTSTAAWRTVLLNGLGGGGQGLYLLDITDPSKYTAGNEDELVLWEFTDADDPDLGYTYSKPTIAMMNNGKFAAIFGNGYNSGVSDGNVGDCSAKLFIAFLEGGLDGNWNTATTDYIKIPTGAGAAGNCNGLSTPAVVDLDGNGTADRVYAGDLKGNLWVFDLCAELTPDTGDCTTIATDWGIAHSNPLMNANDGTNPQPITTKPVVSVDPSGSRADDLIIVFGTGQYLVDADKSTTGLQRMYGVRDYDALNNSAAGGTHWNLDGNAGNPKRWAETVFAIDSGGTGARVFDSTDTAPSNYHGWRIDLPTAGERVVVNPKIRNNIVFFNTTIPNDTKCSYGGSGWLMSVSLTNGGLPPASVFDLNGDGIIDSSDSTDDGLAAGEKLSEMPAESTFLGDNQYTPDSKGNITKRKVNIGTSSREGRMSWKEVYEEQ